MAQFSPGRRQGNFLSFSSTKDSALLRLITFEQSFSDTKGIFQKPVNSLFLLSEKGVWSVSLAESFTSVRSLHFSDRAQLKGRTLCDIHGRRFKALCDATVGLEPFPRLATTPRDRCCPPALRDPLAPWFTAPFKCGRSSQAFQLSISRRLKPSVLAGGCSYAIADPQ